MPPDSGRGDLPPSSEKVEQKKKSPTEESSEVPREFVVSREQVERMKKSVNEGIELAYDVLEEDYENPSEKNKDQELKFHNRTHTEGVVKRTEKILGAIHGLEEGETPSPETQRVIELGKLIAAFHDVRNMSRTLEVPDPVNQGHTKKVRMRARPGFGPVTLDGLRMKQAKSELGGEPLTASDKENLEALEELGDLGTNEIDSAKELLAYMKNQVDAEGKPMFTEQDQADVQFALAATVPGWDVKMGTVDQINLSPSSRELARAVALADLGEAGMDTEAYMNAADALFLEDNPDVADAMEHPDKYDDDAKARFAKRIKVWAQIQPGFALGRMRRLDQELEGLTDDEKSRVKEAFNAFGEDEVEVEDVLKDGQPTGQKKIAGLKPGVEPQGSIGRAFAVSQERAGMSFDELREQLRVNTAKHKESFVKQ